MPPRYLAAIFDVPHSFPYLFIFLFSEQLKKRHKADQETNKRQVEVLRDGQWLWLSWQQINVGDVVRVRAGAFFPADLLLISSR